MNECIKAIVDEAFDVEASVKDLLAKNYAGLVADVVKDAEDGSAIASKLSDLKAEAQSLVSDPAADADLLAYVSAKVAGDSSKAAKIIPAAAKLALDVVADAEALIAAVKS